MARSITKTRGAATYLGDILRSEFDRKYNMVSAKIKNPSSSVDLSGFNPLGQPVKLVSDVWQFVLATDEANTGGLFMDQRLLTLAHGATSDDLFMILVRGPAVIDKDALPTTDIEGTALTNATIVTALAALSPKITTVSALTPTKTQTT